MGFVWKLFSAQHIRTSPFASDVRLTFYAVTLTRLSLIATVFAIKLAASAAKRECTLRSTTHLRGGIFSEWALSFKDQLSLEHKIAEICGILMCLRCCCFAGKYRHTKRRSFRRQLTSSTARRAVERSFAHPFGSHLASPTECQR